VLKLQSKDQLFSYDTFSLGEFYVSPLLFRNVAFEGSPVMMLGAMIHERKLTSHHDIFFSHILNGIKHRGKPIVTDDEAAIVAAIRNKTNLIRLGCIRHLLDDVDRWVDNHLGRKDDRCVYVDEVRDLMNCDTIEEFTKLLATKENIWSEAFIDYFRDRILIKADEYGLWSINNHLSCSKLVTSNQSEGFNTLLKSLQGWKEVPLDVILLSLQMLQKYYYNEIMRGRCGIGNYSLKECFVDSMSLIIEQVTALPTVPPSDIIQSIRDKDFLAEETPSPVYSNVKYTQAKEIIAQDNISFSAKLGVFTVSAGTVETVTMSPETCS
jgi:hypothetical protein